MTIEMVSRRIVGVMVVYDPPEQVHASIERALAQVDHLVIVDNANNTELESWVGGQPSVERMTFLRNPENGLAKAQNMGIRKAIDLHAEWLLLLDDDSMPARNMVSELVAVYDALAEDERQKVAIMAPYLDEPELGVEPRYIQPCMNGLGFRRRKFGDAKILSNVYYVCASGSLIPMSVFDAIGQMDEAFFIYFIDTEFCLRARAYGYDIYTVASAHLQHRIGRRTNHTFLGKKVSTTNHSPEARYWMARSRAKLWWRYCVKDTGYVLFDLIRFGYEIGRIVLFEKEKLGKLCAMWRGVFQMPK